MSVADRQGQGHDDSPATVDVSDLGTISQAALDADRADPARRAEHQAALDALDRLERDGRLLLG
jgi:hypothetical protein